jgi:HTH-type transcriptional regulator / antitoxin HigA
MSAIATQFDTKLYCRLLAGALPKPIESEEDNERMLAAFEKLTEKGEEMSAEEEALAGLLAALIEDFEERHYRPPQAAPHDVLRHLMDVHDLKQSDLWDLFGSKGIASEVLSGKRGISKAHARKLAERFNVPADLFI